MVQTTKIPLRSIVKERKSSRAVVLEHAANELVFAVVGHVGSGTTKIAEALQSLLKQKSLLPGGPYDVALVKARPIISEWAQKNGHPLPDPSQEGTLEFVRAFQDLGDLMREGDHTREGDHAAVAKGFVLAIRRTRAKKIGANENTAEPIQPDGKPRAYILDSI